MHDTSIDFIIKDLHESIEENKLKLDKERPSSIMYSYYMGKRDALESSLGLIEIFKEREIMKSI